MTAAVLAVAMVLSACAADRRVQPDVPPQVDGTLPEQTQQDLSAAVDFAMAATGSPGALVGVWAPWSGQWVDGVGVADLATGEPATSTMGFRAAALTRAMTCDVLYGLVADGTVALSDPVTDYVPTVVGLDDVTLEQLCDGTSGLGAYRPSVESMWVQNPGRVWDPRELIAFGLGRRDKGTPGTTWIDSDAGYQLLGLALESASGKSAAQLYAQYVVRPLGLTDTTLPDPSPAAPGTDPLHGYVAMPGPDGARACTAPTEVTELSSSVGFTDSGVVSTLEDAKVYAQSLATGALLPDGIDRFADAKPAGADAPTWFTTAGGAFLAGSLVGQYGSLPGYLTAAFADPRTGLTVVVVLNDSAAPAAVAGYLAWQLAAIASKAPAAAGRDAVDAGLPWTAQQYHDAIAAAAVCPVG